MKRRLDIEDTENTSSIRSQNPIRHRRQEPVSCHFCQKKKLKCDRGAPCSNCQARKLLCSSNLGEIIAEPEYWRGINVKLITSNLNAQTHLIRSTSPSLRLNSIVQHRQKVWVVLILILVPTKRGTVTILTVRDHFETVYSKVEGQKQLNYSHLALICKIFTLSVYFSTNIDQENRRDASNWGIIAQNALSASDCIENLQWKLCRALYWSACTFCQMSLVQLGCSET